MTRAATLYESLLGERFDSLPPVLRRFHAQAGGRAQGLLRVERGRGRIARVAGWIMNMPAASERVAVELHIALERGREVWTRSFASPSPDTRTRTMVTRQWREGSDLVEAIGLTRTHFELELEPEGMRFVQRRCTILGLTIPSVLAPHVHARASASDPEGWAIEVRISLPVIGLLVEYAGRLIPDA